LAYGNYRHADNECEVRRFMSRELNAAAQTLTLTRRWEVNGQLQAANAAAVTAAAAALAAAYALPFRDLVLYQSDGTTVHDEMLNAGSKTGVVILSGPDFPTGRGAEGGTYLSYSLVASATYSFSRSGSPTDPQRLQQWQETVTESGGGPRWAVVEVVEGDPVRQMLNSVTKVRVVQQGSATGYGGYPSPPAPLYPDWENEAERQVGRQTPQQPGPQQPTGYPISWTYVFEGPGIGGSEPNAWPF
jgi:hypothetical protein